MLSHWQNSLWIRQMQRTHSCWKGQFQPSYLPSVKSWRTSHISRKQDTISPSDWKPSMKVLETTSSTMPWPREWRGMKDKWLLKLWLSKYLPNMTCLQTPKSHRKSNLYHMWAAIGVPNLQLEPPHLQDHHSEPWTRNPSHKRQKTTTNDK